MLKTTLGILSKMQKQPKFPSADEWGKKKKKKRCMHTVEYYLAVKRNEVPIYATT